MTAKTKRAFKKLKEQIDSESKPLNSAEYRALLEELATEIQTRTAELDDDERDCDA